jgi:enoyl-CoA hydratase/carnithine racemase
VPLVGLARAKDTLFSGRVVGAAEAAEIGFLQVVAPAADAEARAIELARSLTANSAHGLRTLKAMFRELEGTEARVASENARLLAFQRAGAGLPRRTG